MLDFPRGLEDARASHVACGRRNLVKEVRAMPLEFVSRQKWGAQPPRSVTKRDPSTLSGVAVHWFGTTNGANDIGYNHAVCPHGFAFTLRGFGVQTGANGNTRANQEYAAVVYMGGEKDGRPVTKEALPV